MAIRNRASSNFMMIPKEVFNLWVAEKMSSTAYKVYSYSIGHTDNWSVSMADVRNHFGWSRTTMTSVMKELEGLGFLIYTHKYRGAKNYDLDVLPSWLRESEAKTVVTEPEAKSHGFATFDDFFAKDAIEV